MIRFLLGVVVGLTSVGCASGHIGSSEFFSERQNPAGDGGLTGDAPEVADAMPIPDAESMPAEERMPEEDPPGCIPEAEVCDGVDNDCDGSVDEGAAGCPCETMIRGATTYLLCDRELSWPGARLHCESLGYQLVVIDDAVENARIYDAISARGFGGTWIGHNDLLVEGDWVWLAGRPMVYTNWDDGEPNNGGCSSEDEDCGIIMTREGRSRRWDDRPCSSERRYICEASLAP